MVPAAAAGVLGVLELEVLLELEPESDELEVLLALEDEDELLELEALPSFLVEL
ncbi:MAG: hypothetical protein ACXU86_10075 [Archangium sp.]